MVNKMVAQCCETDTDCPKHAAACALYSALVSASHILYEMASNAGDVPEWNKGGRYYKVFQEVKAAGRKAEHRYKEVQ